MKHITNSFLLRLFIGFAFFLSLTDIHAQNVPVLSQTAPPDNLVQITVPEVLSNINSGYNYLRIYTPLRKITNDASITVSSAVNDVSITTTFKDGFNKPIEQVKRNATTNTNGYLVVPFDTRIPAGIAYQFLPYARSIDASTFTGNNAHYDNATFTSQKDYYNNLYPGEGYTSYSSIQNLSDAVSRKIKTSLPGKSQIGQQRGEVSARITNDANTIKLWSLDAAGLPVTNGYYPANELFGVETTTPENVTSLVYNDKDGRVVYKRQLLASSPLTYAQTYYVYDALGNPRYTITPKAVDAIGSSTTVSSAILGNLCFTYAYDAKGRMVATRKPGQLDSNATVYDRFKRVVMTQSPTEKAQGKWEVIFYDKLGRTIATSLYSSTSNRTYWQGIMDTPPANQTTAMLPYYLTTDIGEGVYPAETAISGNVMMNYFYYDTYDNTIDFNGTLYNQMVTEQLFGSDLLSTIQSETPVKSLRTQNLVTSSKTRILRSTNAPATIGDWRYSIFYYDDKGRTINVAQYDKLSSQLATDYQHANFVSNQYDFNDNLILSKHTIRNNLSVDGNNKHVELIKNDIELSTGNLIATSHKINNGAWSVIASYSYDELGRVSRQILGNYGEVQDLSYNIRGQLTGVNAVYAETGNKQGESRTFGQSLKYDYGFSQLNFDGKITGMVWRGSGGTGAKPMSYGYLYDKGGRLASADFRALENTVWSNTVTDFTVSNLKYDAGGDILSMKQRGIVLENGSYVPKDIDRLKYNYEVNSSRLAAVEDTVTLNYNIGDFVNNNIGSTDYKYDANGNLTQDLNKKINLIDYNHLDKPVNVVFTNGDRIEYSYDAAGNKLEEVIKPASTAINRTDFIGNFVYKNDSLSYFLTSKGRSVFNHNDGSTKEEFFVKDYLGNVRSVIDIVNMPILQYLATYELASANMEGLLFEALNEVRDDKPASIDPDDMMAGRLNGNEPNHRVGTSLLMKVMAGDKIEMNVNNYYEGYVSGNDHPVPAEQMLSTIITTLTGGVGGFEGSESHNTTMVSRLFTSNNYLGIYNPIVQGTTDPSKPRAHLNYILFNDKMEIVPSFSGAFQADGANAWSSIGTSQPLEIPLNGYIAVYLDNQSTMNVFFDLLDVRFARGSLKDEAHYYPYGLPMGSMGSSAMGFLPNKYKYQGNENTKDLGLNLMDFNFRQYDAQIGRFTGVDLLAEMTDMYSPYAAMGNDPVHNTDVNGLMFGGWGGMKWGWYGGMLDEAVIVADAPGKGKVNPNPGGGDDPLAPFVPSGGDWGSGGSNGVGSVYKNNAGGSGGGSASANNAPDNSPSHNGGSPTGSEKGSPNGVAGGTGDINKLPTNNTGEPPSKGVGQPKGLEAAIPVWGSARAAIDDFQNGRWGWGLFNSAMAVSDLFLVKSLATAATKATIIGIGKISAQKTLSSGAAKLTQDGLEHVVARHWATSTAKGAGKFSAGTTARGLKNMIGTTTTKGAFRANSFGRAGTVAEYNFGNIIGTTSKGLPASNLRVVIGANGNVITAFPF